jgi:group I intron endonuclease
MNSISYSGPAVYGILNKKNNNIYIGGSKNVSTRVKEHNIKLKFKKHENRHLQKDWNEFGFDSFEAIIIEKCEKENLIEREQHYIDLYKKTNKIYNMAMLAGRTLGIKRSEETKKKISESLQGRRLQPVGYKHSDETIEKIRKANTGYRHSDESKEKNRQAHLGNTHTEEAKQRISEFQRTQTRSEETKRRISEAKKGTIVSEEPRDKVGYRRVNSK